MSVKIRVGRLIVLLVVGVGAALVAVGDSGEVQKASKMCSRGFKQFEQQAYDKARASFERALTLSPNHPDGHVGIGHLALQAQRYEEALEAYEKARAGNRTIGADLFDEKMKQFADSQRRVSDLRHLLSELQSGREGDSSFRIVEISSQIQVLEALPTPTPDQTAVPPAQIDFHVGNSLVRLRRWDEAIEALESCVTKSPAFAEAYNNLALAYWRKGRPVDARRALVKAEALGLAVNPRFKIDLGL